MLVPSLYLWALVTIISYFYIKDYSATRFLNILVLPALLFVFYVFRSLLFGSLITEISEFETKFSLLVVPLVFPYERAYYFHNRNRFLYAFIAGNAVATTTCYIYAIYNSVSLVNGVFSFNPEINFNI